MIGQIGLKNLEFLPEIVPVLITVLNDDTAAVARQAIACGIDIFRSTLVKVAIQVGLNFLNMQHEFGHSAFSSARTLSKIDNLE